VNLEDAADDRAVGEHIKIVILPLAGWPRGGRTLEEQLLRHNGAMSGNVLACS
jgi:hypothetical protein